jgi:hypothetical protein
MRTLIIATVLLATSCAGEVIEVNAPPPPQEYLTCQTMPTAPDLSALESIQASNGALVYLKPETDARDAKIARYIVDLRQSYFSCSNQLERVSDYYQEQE